MRGRGYDVADRRGYELKLRCGGLIALIAVGTLASLVTRTDSLRVYAALPRLANPVQRENRLPGSKSWSLGQSAPPGSIEGFASEVSVLPGQEVHLHVSTAPAARYRIVLYRLGWYQGAGARMFACIPGCHSDRQGAARLQPHPDPVSGLTRAAWPVTDTFRFPPEAVSGYFLAKLELTSGRDQGKVAYVPLILRALPSQDSSILVQAAVNTWQAYNTWGGKSLYDYYSTDHISATHVSFNRPYSTPFNRPYNATLPPFGSEFGLLRFLEREGYDVSYTTDIDTDRTPAELRRHRLVISSGHDEYWSKGMRDAFEAARSAGTNLAFLGADIADWQIRYEDDRRTIVEYRYATADPENNPALKTVHFRQLVPPRPQCELLGVSYEGVWGLTDPPRSYGVNPAALDDPWLRGTGFTATSTLPGSVGYEWDTIQPGCAVPPLTVLFRYQGAGADGTSTSAEAVRYVAPSGARVFSSGSVWFLRGLDNYHGENHAPPDPRLQRFMRNALADLTSNPNPPASPQGKISARGTVQTAQGPLIGFSATNNCTPLLSTRPGIVGTTDGGRIWTKSTVTESTCTDQPPDSPLGFDTQTGTATGTFGPSAPGGLNGQQGTLEWTYADNSPDMVQFTLKDSSDNIVFEAAEQTPTPFRGSPGGVWTFGP